MAIDKKEDFNDQPNTSQKLSCGVIMPISTIDDLSVDHWQEVKSIIYESISTAGFKPSMVSDGDEVGIIQKRIVQNIYNNPIVVCDVSAKNPNVMFELGMRLAFDKPTIIIKDDITNYSFDTSPIEHLTYPRDLRFTAIIRFKEQLKDKIKATYKASQEDKNYTPFLKHFGEFKVSHLSEQKISSEEYLLRSMEQLKDDMRVMRNIMYNRSNDEIALPSPKRLGKLPSLKNLENSNLNIIKSVLLKTEINNFKQSRNISKLEELHAFDMHNALLTYLWKLEDVRNLFASENELSSIVDKEIGYDLPF